MKSGRYIGVMSGTSLDGVDVVLAAIDENMVAQQASLTWPIPISLKEDILSICQGQQLTLSQLDSWMFARGAVCGCGAGFDAKRTSSSAGCGGHRVSRTNGLA